MRVSDEDLAGLLEHATGSKADKQAYFASHLGVKVPRSYNYDRMLERILEVMGKSAAKDAIGRLVVETASPSLRRALERVKDRPRYAPVASDPVLLFHLYPNDRLSSAGRLLYSAMAGSQPAPEPVDDSTGKRSTRRKRFTDAAVGEGVKSSTSGYAPALEHVEKSQILRFPASLSESEIAARLRANWAEVNFGFDEPLEFLDSEVAISKDATDRVDILARLTNSRRYVLIEIKKGEASDSAVAQVARYRGQLASRGVATDQSICVIMARGFSRKCKDAARGMDRLHLLRFS